MSQVSIETQLQVNKLLQRANLFANLNLGGISDKIDSLVSMGIPRNGFKHNNNDTAPFSFFVQLGALIDQAAEFDESFDFHNQTNDSLLAYKNFVYWLAASLFKLNLHIASDPFALYGDENAKQIHEVNNAVLGRMGVEPRIFNPIFEAFKLIREVSFVSYRAFLEGEDAPTINATMVNRFLERFEELGDPGNYIGPAAIIALAYTQTIFSIGTTKDLAENIKIGFSVDKDEDGYSQSTVINAFHTRFSKYAASYASWLIKDEDGSFVEEEDIEDFHPGQQVILQLEDEPVFVLIPSGEFHIKVLGNAIQFSQMITEAFPDKRLKALAFSIF
jgi:hypothetical protein